MKSKILFFSGLFCACTTFSAVASDCEGEGCLIMPLSNSASMPTFVGKPAPLPAAFGLTQNTIDTSCTDPAPEIIEVISISPDDRPPVWDGTHKKYKSQGLVKTVDWRDGVPLWDESLVHYKDKDFRDWFIPQYQPQIDEYDFNVRDQIEELLIPYRPDGNLWAEDRYQEQDLGCVIRETFGDGCPFETEKECDIWRRKPMVREVVSPRSSKIRTKNMYEFIEAANRNKDITANVPVSAPFLDRYKMLMKSAQACCTDGMTNALKRAGASDGLVYKFLSDDANFYQFSNRCLMMTDQELDKEYPNTATAAVAADVRNGCLCRGRGWFRAMLAPFEDAYKAAPEFANARFNYTYTDGLQREITASVNTDVKNVLDQLALCP